MELCPLHSREEILSTLSKLATVPMLAYDTETTGLEWWAKDFRVFYMSFCDGERGYGFYVPPELDPELRSALEKIFLNERQTHIGWNIKFDLHAIRTMGLEDKGILMDGQFATRLVNENEPMNLEYQSKTYLPDGDQKLSDSVDAWFKKNHIKKDARRYDSLPPEILEPYAIQDACATFALTQMKLEELRRLDAEAPMDEVEGVGPRGLLRVLDIENEAVRVLVDIEARGYRVDPDHFRKLGPRLLAEADAVEENIKRELTETYGYEVKPDFNLLSPETIADVFLFALNIDPERFNKTDKGAISFDSDSLERLGHPLADAVLSYREKMKLAGTFGETLLRSCDEEWNLHPNYKQVHPTTGRMSCSEPNIQNLPRIDTDHPEAACNEIRKGFLCRPGYTLVYMDYSQIEMRIFAHYCQDPTLLRAIREGLDLHRETAALVYGKDVKDVTKEERQHAKTTNFTIVYGSGAANLGKQLKLPYPDAKAFRTLYLEKFPAIKDFFKEVEQALVGRGWVRTFFGRRRRLDPSKAYVGPNAIVQGTSTGDLHKIGLVRVWRMLRENGWGYIVNPVHDEIGMEIKTDKLSEAVPALKAALEDFSFFSIPLCVDVETSTTCWGDKKKWGG